jgi:hypothetical protein
MSSVSESLTERPPPSGGGVRWVRDSLIWIPGCLLLGLFTARAAVDIQSYFAPLLLFPLLLGVLLGALLVLFMRMAQVGHRPTIVVGSLLAAGVAVVGIHYLAYREAIAEDSARLEQLRSVLPETETHRFPLPESFIEYLTKKAAQGRSVFQTHSLHGGYVWLLWLVEAGLLMTATLLVVIPGMRFTFCRRCHSWYRTIRSARLPAAAIGELAALLNIEIPEGLRSGRCRLLACLSGCGPTGCELAWEDRGGQTYFARVWLLSEQRNGVIGILDRYAEEKTLV